MPGISASIVIYKNDPVILGRAVESFLNSTSNSTLYLIDNSPQARNFDFLSNDRIVYIFNDRNLGFGAGHNIALRKVIESDSSDYHLVLNPDVYFTKEVVETLSSFMEQSKEVGLVMPKVLYPDGRLQPLCKMLPTPTILFSRRFFSFRNSWITQMNHWYEMHYSGYDKIMDVPFLSGCFMFLRTDALKKVGLFDERIFLYTEDTDLTRRIHKYYRTVFYPDVTIYHIHEKSSYKRLPVFFRHVQSTVTYFNKWGWFIDKERENINQQILLKYSR